MSKDYRSKAVPNLVIDTDQVEDMTRPKFYGSEYYGFYVQMKNLKLPVSIGTEADKSNLVLEDYKNLKNG